MTPEGRVQAYLIRRVKAAGGRARRLRWIGRRGAPDVLIWWPGRQPCLAALVEVKREGKSPTRQQQAEHRRLLEDGWLLHVVDTKEGCDALISHLCKLWVADNNGLLRTRRGDTSD